VGREDKTISIWLSTIVSLLNFQALSAVSGKLLGKFAGRILLLSLATAG